MLQEILLSLSGHPSPLLRADLPNDALAHAGITPPERQLLASAAHLSDVHVKLINATAEIVDSHPSTLCRAVAAAVDALHLAAFQRKVLDVEEGILKDDPDLVGAYNIVPLTAVMGEFKQWTRRLEWLWETVKFMMTRDGQGRPCHGARLIDRLRGELQSGYEDVRSTAMSLVAVAEAAWLKQVSAWTLYGRLSTLGGNDFCIQKVGGSDEDFSLIPELLPSFVSPSTASSMLFIGRSLNHVRVKSLVNSGLRGVDHVSSKLRELGRLTYPLDSASFSRAILSIRLSLAEDTLQKILPSSKVVEALQIFRDFFLLGRGEFALALTQEADEKIRNRWQRADNLAHEPGNGLTYITVKDGEVSAVLARTWAVMVSMQGQLADEDEEMELARDLISLHLDKKGTSPATGPGVAVATSLAALPFRNLLFSVPASLSIQLPSPLDMVFSPADVEIYSCVNAYLQSMRRAHIRLTDLWKITSLRRHHPAIRGGDAAAVELRKRWTARTSSLRSSWTTASAAIFFLGETEAYFQTEIVSGLWDGFHDWLDGGRDHNKKALSTVASPAPPAQEDDQDDDLWLSEEPAKPEKSIFTRPNAPHDPQALTTAHTIYLHTLVHHLLLTQSTFTTPLYTLLVHIDHLVSHIRRLHSIFTSVDLETDAGVIDAFVDLQREEKEVTALLRGVEERVRRGIGEVVAALRALEADPEFAAEWERDGVMSPEAADEVGAAAEEVGFKPARTGGINRLLMKLDFGSWVGGGGGWDDV